MEAMDIIAILFLVLVAFVPTVLAIFQSWQDYDPVSVSQAAKTRLGALGGAFLATIGWKWLVHGEIDIELLLLMALAGVALSVFGFLIDLWILRRENREKITETNI